MSPDRDFILACIAESGLSATALAAAAGLSTSTLNRAINNPNHKFRLSQRTIMNLISVTGVPFPLPKDWPRDDGGSPVKLITGASQIGFSDAEEGRRFLMDDIIHT